MPGGVAKCRMIVPFADHYPNVQPGDLEPPQQFVLLEMARWPGLLACLDVGHGLQPLAKADDPSQSALIDDKSSD